MLYALRGPLAASVGRLTVWEYRDSHKGAKRRDGAVNGLYGGFTFWRVLRTARHKRKNSRMEAIGGYTSGGSYAGSTGTQPDALELLEGMKKPATD